MAKVRVAEWQRPPERFKPIWNKGQRSGAAGWYKVVGSFRPPKRGEFFWALDAVCQAAFDFEHPNCIMVPCDPPADAMIAEDKKAGEAQS